MDYSILRRWVFAVAGLCLVLSLGCAEDYRTVVDSRGVSVQVPVEIERVVTISDGFVEEVMTYLGVAGKLVGVGSRTFEEIDSYTYETVSGGTFSHQDGMNTVSYINPWIMELPIVAEYGAGANFEAISSLDPDLIIIRLGSCTFWTNDENVQKSIEIVESLGIPVVVLLGTDFYDHPDISTMWDEIEVIGRVFDKEEEAEDLVEYLQETVALVSKRTRDVPEEEKPTVLYFGLSPLAREEGGAGNTVSRKSFESWAIEELVHAQNAFRDDSGYWHKISTEHVLAMNPDVIVLPTDWGYHPVREILEAPYYQNLQDLDAIKNGRVVSLPWTPYDCAKRLGYPIEVVIIAKAAYPERFEDIKVHEWVLEFYQNVYGVDEETAIGLRSAQWLDWTVEEDF